MPASLLDKLSLDELRAELRARESFVALGASSDAISGPHPDLKDVDTATVLASLRTRQKAVYGDDDRRETVDVPSPKIRALAQSTAAIFRLGDLMDTGAGFTTLPVKTLDRRRREIGVPLCDSEPFRDQPACAKGTAFLVAEDVVATAGHCVNETNLTHYRFVFGYAMTADRRLPTQVPVSQVYMGTRFLGWKHDITAADWALVKLDRAVTGRSPLAMRVAGKVAQGQGLFVIGHPAGLPQKVAGNAEVRVNDHADFFVANLDTLGGNSGSPVFNADTFEVEGILVRGDRDFTTVGGCQVSLVCPVQGCRGEDCTRINLVAACLGADLSGCEPS